MRIAADLGGGFEDLGLVGQGGEVLGVNAHGKRSQANFAVFKLQAVQPCFQTQQSQHSAGEVPHETVGVKSDQVGTQQAAKNLLSPGEDAEHFR